MIQLSSLSLYRGSRCLLDDVNLTIYPGFSVGLTGQNGMGKSSLFALLQGQLTPEKGECSIIKSAVIAHVAQETDALDCSALDFVLDGDQELRHIQDAIRLAELAEDGEGIAEAYADLESVDGYTAESRAATLLDGLGFSDQELTNSVAEFSGGWRVRLNLAQALMCRSDILLLDEPTNHLDLDSVLWLEQWLQRYSGTLIVISHDRMFLDNVVQHIIYIENKKAKLYTGNYSQFERVRSEALALQQKMFVKQQAQKAHMQAFIDRFKAKATKARQAQSRIKALERMAIIAPAHVDSPFSFSFKSPDSLPFQLMTLNEVSVGYSDRLILHEVKFQLNPGDRIGLLGVNGAGKSTLIKVLAGEKQPHSGECFWAENLQVGYFAQHQLEQLDPNASTILHIQRLSPDESERSIRAFVGGFGFGNDKLEAPVGQFSGGEKSRLVLAMLVWQRPQVLLLDEPTNHLDLDMRHALNTALQAFEGALVIVSHDRHLLQSVCDEFYRVHDGKVEAYPNDFDEYQQWLQVQKRVDEQLTQKKLPSEAVSSADSKHPRQQSHTHRDAQKLLRKELTQLEQQLNEVENTLNRLDADLANPALYAEEATSDAVAKLAKQKTDAQRVMESLEAKWLECQERLEKLSE